MPRIALVIGNANYQQKENRLDNPVNDAQLVSKTLKSLGFEVITGEDLTNRQTKELIQKFKKRLTKGSVALFYYAGHGVQYRGANFMIPIDVADLTEDKIHDQAIDVNSVIEEIANAEADVNLIFLDACRGNLTTRSWISRREGFASIDGPKGTVIAYSTAAGHVADDGRGKKNSPYTEALVRWMQHPCLKIEDVFKRVRTDVWRVSGQKQLTWESGSLFGDFFFAGTRCSSGVMVTSSLTEDRDRASAAQSVLLDNESLVVKIGDDKSHNEYMGPISDRIIAHGLKVINSTSLPARDLAQLNGYFLEASRTRDKTGLHWLPYPLILRIFAYSENLESQLIGQSTSEASIWIRVYRTDTAEEVESYSNSQNKARGYGTTEAQAQHNALRAAVQQIPSTFFERLANKAKLVQTGSQPTISQDSREESVVGPTSVSMDNSRRVVLKIRPLFFSRTEKGEEETLVKEFYSPFSQALKARGFTVDDFASLTDRDKSQLDGELHPPIRRGTAITDARTTAVVTPPKKDLRWLPYQVVIEATLRATDSKEYFGKFMTEATIQIDVYLTKDGETLTSYYSYEDKPRGHGSTQGEARRNAMRAAAQTIPEKFFKDILEKAK